MLEEPTTDTTPETVAAVPETTPEASQAPAAAEEVQPPKTRTSPTRTRRTTTRAKKTASDEAPTPETSPADPVPPADPGQSADPVPPTAPVDAADAALENPAEAALPGEIQPEATTIPAGQTPAAEGRVGSFARKGQARKPAARRRAAAAAETPAGDVPPAEAPVAEASAEEAPLTEAPAEPAPLVEVPLLEVPLPEAPVVEAPAEPAPPAAAPKAARKFVIDPIKSEPAKPVVIPVVRPAAVGEAAPASTETGTPAEAPAQTAPAGESAPVRSSRRRGARPAPSAESGAVTAEAAPDAVFTGQAEDDDPIGAALNALGRSRQGKTFQAPRPAADLAGQPELDSLAQAIAVADDSDSEGAETGAESDGPSRRHRRRGGRKRHRDGVVPDGTGEAVAASPSEEGAEASDEVAGEDDNGDDNARHHRRRRRRRGEEIEPADDEGAEVVVKVRDPRAAAKAKSSDIAGIDGSTRLEAKKQRRREGRAASRQRAPILSEAEFLARRESVERKMLIRQKTDYSQIAVIEDGILVEHYVDRASATSLIGNIYLGKVQNVLPGMEAAFIDIGRGRNAVLYAGEVDWDSFGEAGQNRKIEDVFSAGQLAVVQVSKDPVGAKGARLTSHISIPGRYVVYAPKGHISGISRKLSEVERNRLKSILDSLVDESASVVIRTAAEGASEEELVHDVNRLKAQWEVIEKKAGGKQAPLLLYAEPDLTMRIVRDLFTEDFTSLVVDGNGGMEDAFETVSAYVKHVAPHLAARIEHWDHDKSGDLFAKFRIDEQIAKALDRKVHLPSGGSLVIDRTEAMTVIDVNTGKFTGSGGNLEATVTSNNLEAAEEIVRQLRLRDIGGIIIIDFIDMVLPSNRDLLLRRLVECLGRDRTRHQVSEVTSLGLVQLTRKKVGTGLAEAFTKVCDACTGLGHIRFDEPVDSQTPADGGERSPARRYRRRG